MNRRRNENSYTRKKRHIRPSPFFIIVCEGQVTEEDYFKSFPYYHSLGKEKTQGQRFSHKAVHIEAGAGQHKKVVERADKIFKKFVSEYGTISPSEVWCVFDCDGDTEALREAVELAVKKGFNPIYSVQCFELWFVLHFQVLTAAIPKKEYDNKISAHFNINYSHGTRGMYELLAPYQKNAIAAAEQLWDNKKRNVYEDPVTNVHNLVLSLNYAFDNLKKRK